LRQRHYFSGAGGNLAGAYEYQRRIAAKLFC
jgi:hypothetical protein